MKTNNLFNTEYQALYIYTQVNFNFQSSYISQDHYYPHSTDGPTGDIS